MTVFMMCSKDNVHIPNAFTPNGDGFNDVFRPLLYEDALEEITTFDIYNRWGQKVFEGGGKEIEWDATFKGENVPSGVYIYIMRIGCSSGEDMLHGDISVIR